MKKLRKFIKRYVPTWALAAIILTLISGILMLISISFPRFSELLVGLFGLPLRFVSAKLTGWLPFSLFELLILALPLIFGLLLFLFLRRGRCKRYRLRLLFSLVGIIGILYSSYIFMLGVGYRTRRLAYRLELDPTPMVNAESLTELAVLLRDRVNELAPSVSVNGEGVTEYGEGYRSLSASLSDAYHTLGKEYPIFLNFSSTVKPVMSSEVMACAGITGIYGYLTGEANICTSYPDYSTVYTAAHEMAHQRGFAREDEANFIAFLACTSSDDDYIRYSGYLNMLQYAVSALYRTDKELYYEVMEELCDTAKRDISASSAVSRKYKDSFLNKLMDKVNDGYLKSQGTEGVVSYGYVVRLAVAYYGK